MSSWEVITGDSLRVLADLEPESVDAIVSDPPYGLEFMGREWDRFREDDPATSRHRGDRAGEHGEVRPVERREAAGGVRVEYGGGKRPTTSRCTGCGKRDQFRKPHDCAPGARWALELIDAHAAPPSMLAFQSWCREWARLAYRVLKPGGHLLAFGGTRTAHRMVCGVEDAGFEVRDSLVWLYGQGFPKSLDVSKAIDAAAGATREVVGSRDRYRDGRKRRDLGPVPNLYEHGLDGRNGYDDVTAPTTPDAERWQGWGTALKPAHEPIVVARKPLTSSVAANVLEHGTGALNVDGCRIEGAPRTTHADGDHRQVLTSKGAPGGAWGNPDHDMGASDLVYEARAGRWPANVVLDPEAAAMLDEQSGPTGSWSPSRREGGAEHDGALFGTRREGSHFGDFGGGASRFFYCAKASTAERNALELSYLPRARSARKHAQQDAADRWRSRARNRHPTVKPVDVMRWLVRLVTPPGGLVVDPFAGSGTTGCAAMLERRRFLGIERDVGSAIIGRARIAWWAEHPDGMELVRRLEVEAAREAVAAAGQLDLFAPNGNVGSAA